MHSLTARIRLSKFVLAALSCVSNTSSFHSAFLTKSHPTHHSTIMEALVAVGLASNIVQFISFAQDLVSTSKQISRNADGALIENHELESIAMNLSRLGSNLLVKTSHNATCTKEDEDLRKLCEGCRHVSKLLIEKLRSLKVDSKFSGSVGRQWASFRQALNSVMNAEEIADLEGRLDRYQKGINSALLASLRYDRLRGQVTPLLTPEIERKSTKPRRTGKHAIPV